jgi:hypothetical protein
MKYEVFFTVVYALCNSSIIINYLTATGWLPPVTQILYHSAILIMQWNPIMWIEDADGYG